MDCDKSKFIKRVLAIILFLQFFPIITFSQNLKLKGLIVDYHTNEPVPGAAIKLAEGERYTTSNSEGKFELKVNGNIDVLTLEIKHLAYKENIFQILKESINENFVVYLLPTTLELDKVIVSDFKSFSKFDDLTELSSVLKGKELQRGLGITLASTVKNEIGVAMRSMGPAPARPVIRGMGANRVFISEDGNKTIDLSATSPDHAVTIDPFNLNRIEILRGPKVLIKTPVSTGGIVNVVKNEIPEKLHSHPIIALGTYGESANKGYLTSALIEMPFKSVAFKGELSRRKSSDLKTPKGTLRNSYSESLNYLLSGSYFIDNGFIGASFKRFELDYGVPGGFIGAHPNGVDIEMFRRQFQIKSQFHFKNKIAERIDISFNNVLYRHKEFEASGSIGSEFRILNNNGFINFSHSDIGFLQNGQYGISFEHRDFDIGGFVFTSPAISFNIALYLYEYFNFDDLTFEFSTRYEYNLIDPENKIFSSKIGEIRKRKFQNYSFSLSTLYGLTDIVFIGFNINKSSRVPTIEELYSRGPHLAAYSYEIGNPNLKDESGLGTEIFIYHKWDRLYFSFNAFRNDFSYYILPRATGEINYQTLLPIYQTFGMKVRFYGIENIVEWKPVPKVKISNSISYTYGKFSGGDNPLPQIPPFKGTFVLNYQNTYFSGGLEAEWASSQKRVDLFEEPTESYLVFNIFTQFSLNYNDLIHNISLSIDNLLDKEYYNHLSRIKSILPEAGRNFRLTYKLFYNL